MKRFRLFLTYAVLAVGFCATGCAPVPFAEQSGASMTGQVSQVSIDRSGSGRDRQRIPGGSGCDDPGDLIEHLECRK